MMERLWHDPLRATLLNQAHGKDGVQIGKAFLPKHLERRNPQPTSYPPLAKQFRGPIMRGMETTNLDLVFLDSEPKTKGQLAQVRVKATGSRNSGAHKAEGLITAPCTSFREFDAEIRRLQTELEIIRAEARKKFSRAQAVVIAAA
jgi:hypothetical protein